MTEVHGYTWPPWPRRCHWTDRCDWGYRRKRDTRRQGCERLTGTAGKDGKGRIGSRNEALSGVLQHIDEIYAELELQVARMTDLQRQVNELRGKIREI